jgi:hypothetical protein
MRVSQVLFNATGSSAFPVSNLTIRGLEIRDTALTYYGADQASKHGMPTGGDWTLERSGAVLLEGTEFSTISECLFERIDGESLSHPCLLRRVIQPYYTWTSLVCPLSRLDLTLGCCGNRILR